MELLTEFIDFNLDDKPISPTLTHMDILRRGLIRSITRYFAHNQQTYTTSPAKQRVQLEKSDHVYSERLAELYKDYLGDAEYASISECGLKVDSIVNELSNLVADVDFDKRLKDLPWAHFDANTFIESNR